MGRIRRKNKRKSDASCRRPTSKGWVMCGKCGAWHHIGCTGLTQKERQELQDEEEDDESEYYCGLCGKERLVVKRKKGLVDKRRKR